MTLQERIEYLLKERNITKAELARRIDKPYTTVDNWFKRKSEPGCTLAQPISKALGVSIEFLITGKENTKPITILPDAEQKLLDYYHAANEEGQERILEQAEILSYRHPSNLKNLNKKGS